MKTNVSKKKGRVRVFVDFADTRSNKFEKNEKVRETIFAGSYGAQDEYIKQKMVENLCPFKLKNSISKLN